MFPNIYGNTIYSHHTYIITAGSTINEDYKETLDLLLFNYTNNKLVVPYGQKISHVIVKENLVYPVIRSADPDPDDDTITGEECNGLSEKSGKLNLTKQQR